ncbi:MAG: DUF2298 domain-containing protein [Bdellovibrionota bacterium]
MKNFFKNNKILIFILLFAATLRFLNLGFQIGSHPDERGIVMISLNTATNNYNPQNFHYGHFVYYLLFFSSQFFKYLSGTFPKIEIFKFLSSYDGAFYIGRSYAVVLSLITIFFTYLLSYRLFNKKIALYSSFFLATNPFFISLSRYYTTDIFVVCFMVMSAYYALKAYELSSYKNYLLSVFLASLGFTSKISIAMLVFPLTYIFILFLLKNKNYKSFKFYFQYVLVPIALSLLTIFIFEPFLFLDFSSFIKDNKLQLDMIKGKYMPPYTRQYLETSRVLYHLEQMLFYTIRPVGFILMILGFYSLYGKCSKCTKYTKKENFKLAKIFLFLLVVPAFLITSTYFVKFPRYLLSIYPYLMIFVALGVVFFKNYKEKVVGIFAIIVSIILALDSISIYFKEHSYVVASRWIYENVPKFSTIANPHWDDVLPLHLPNISASDFKYNYHTREQELALYEESTDSNLEKFANTLLNADYITFPADRMFRGILDKFSQNREYSIKILSSLFDGSLGFEKVYVYKSLSLLSTLGVYSDDLADESLTGYSNPKTYIFKKVKQLNLDELKDTIKTPNNKKILDKVLKEKNFDINSLVVDLSTPRKSSTFFTSIYYIIFWLIAVDLMSMYILPFLFIVCKNFRDKGYGIFRVLGLVVFAFVVWILAIVFGFKITRFNLFVVLLSLYVVSYWFAKIKNIKILDIKEAFLKNILKIEVFYLSIFLIFAIFKFLSPEIVWGEKTMDLGFLNYFIRLETLPCGDPWSVGSKLSYYFFGYFTFSLIHKLFLIPSEYGFNLSLILSASMLATSLLTLFYYFKKSINFSIFASASVLLLSNLEMFYIYFFDKTKVWQLNFDLYWKAARVHEKYSHAISEFPFWSFIFSDLHPHVMAMPIFICMLICFAYIYKEEKYNKLFFILFPITAVVLCMTNTWDVVSISFLATVFTLLLIFFKCRKSLYVIKTFFILSIISLVFFCPFYLYHLSASDNSINWVQASEFHRAFHVFRHFGVWLFLIFLSFLVNIKSLLKKTSLLKIFLYLVASSVPFIFASFSPFENISLGIQAISASLIFIGLISLGDDNFLRSVFIVTFAILLSFTELCYIADRPNTIFKFYLGMWFLIGVASLLSLEDILKYKISIFLCSVLFFISLASSCVIYYIMAKHTHVGTEKVIGTLNGTEFLKSRYQDRLNVVSYINSHIFKTPVLMEAYGKPYMPNTTLPYQKYTGLPIVQGWAHHTFQRGTSRESIAEKKRDIDSFYLTLNKNEIKRIIDKYNISLVVVGEKEREKYPLLSNDASNKFKLYNDIFISLYSSNGEAVYLVHKNRADFKNSVDFFVGY